MLFNVPKFMEYTWKESDIRTDYDLEELHWTDIQERLSSDLKVGGHLTFMENHRDITESGARDRK